MLRFLDSLSLSLGRKGGKERIETLLFVGRGEEMNDICMKQGGEEENTAATILMQ